MIRITAIVFSLLAVGCGIASAEVRHPLDALEADEIVRAAAILRAAGHSDEATPILSLVLEAPEKGAVLAWKTGDNIPRQARAVIRKDRVNREFVIDLVSGQIVDVATIAGPGQPPVVFDEILAAIDIAVSNEAMQSGLKKRGITDFAALFCAPRTGGNFGAPFEQSRRVVKVDCFDLSNNPKNIFAAPIEGLFAIIDLESKEVLDVIDLGVVPVTQTSYSLDPDAQEKIRELNPVNIVAPQGSNIHVDGWNVSWQNWRFHMRWDMRAGLIVSMVQYDDRGTLRNVLYQGNLSEIYVPYQDTSEGWYYRNYMDEGDYGLGTTHSPLVPGADCPNNAVYKTPVMANPAGGADQLSDRICIFEQPTGSATWRHYDILTGDLNARPNVELVVRFIATVGNYDYVFDWVFDNKGQLTYRLGASGLDAVKGVASRSLDDKSAAADTAFGPLVAPGLAGIQHDHFFSLRLDVDIDGRENRFVRDKLVARRQPSDSKRKSIWQTERDVADTDSNAKYRLHLENPSLWRVESSSRENYLGYATSFALKPAANARPLVDEDDPPLARAGFVNYHLWVTPYRDDELWAGGHYSNQSAPGQGLPEWTSENRNVEDTDIVLWYTLGFHHVPSTEDWPVYNLGFNAITLRPYNFFDQNPAMDLPESLHQSSGP
ncbi:MAG: tyramine oxidase [Gammaproteobacteria bacterium]|nr:tyramine oxidase [Gammaproteobacteria bacterium]MDH5302589.1 tyramine oxidase [Gammaproteobacteria bacterium]MDH5321068.1 tyramine oxidase [Gammaproteobacteria bacterium]